MAEIVAEYKINVDKAVAELRRVADATEKTEAALDEAGKSGKKAFDDTGKAADKASTEVKKVEQSSGGVTSALKKVGAAMLAAFAVDRLVAFGREAVNLAAKAEGVERAFKRIGSPELLAGLRAATRGTVSDLILMQNAVKASNFKIPLDQLGSLLQFAQSRARETGESVDYLVDSIINGIGRKSPLILDNLGISAVALRDKLNGVSTEAASIGDVANAVGAIARDALNEIGVQADTTADKIAQLATVWENFGVSAGKVLVNLGTGFAYILGLLPEVNARLDGFNKSLAGQRTTLVDDLASGYRDLTDVYLKVEKQLAKVRDIEKELSELGTNKRDRERRTEIITFLLPAEQARLDMLREVFEEEHKRKNAGPTTSQEEIRNVYFYTNAIKLLKAEIEAEGTSRERIAAILKELPPLQEELARLLGEETEATKKLREEREKLINTPIDEDTDSPQQAAFNSAMLYKEKREHEHYLERKRQREEFDEWFNGKIDAELQAELEKNERIAQADRDAAEARIQLQQQQYYETLFYIGQIQQLFGQLSQAIMMGYDNELKALENSLEAGAISQQEYDRQRRQLERERARTQKEMALFEAILNTAAAVTSALAVGPPAGYILAALSAALGAVEIGIIASQPLPQFAEGGWVDGRGMIHGRSHAHGGVKMEAEGGEFIVNRVQSSKNAELIEAINKGVADAYIMRNWVAPAVDSALLNGWQDVGKSAELNGITANLKDHNIIAAMDRNRQATTYGLKMLADKLDKRTTKRGGYA